jgi:hypothetical protein
MERKWPVAPVSRMAVVIFGGGEGPKLSGVDATVVLLVLNRATGCCTGLGKGVPLAQLGLVFSLLDSKYPDNTGIAEARLDHVAAPHTVV